MPYSFSIQSKVVRSIPGAPLLVRTATHPRHRTLMTLSESAQSCSVKLLTGDGCSL